MLTSRKMDKETKSPITSQTKGGRTAWTSANINPASINWKYHWKWNWIHFLLFLRFSRNKIITELPNKIINEWSHPEWKGINGSNLDSLDNFSQIIFPSICWDLILSCDYSSEDQFPN